MQMLLQQYYLVKQAREVVFAWCGAMKPEHYTGQVENFGRGGSIRNLQVHTANTYRYWLEEFSQYDNPAYFEPEGISSVKAVREIFDEVNNTVVAFCKHLTAGTTMQ